MEVPQYCSIDKLKLNKLADMFVDKQSETSPQLKDRNYVDVAGLVSDSLKEITDSTVEVDSIMTHAGINVHIQICENMIIF